MQKRVVKNNLNNFGTLHIPKEQKRASYLFKSVIFLEFPTFFKVIKILKRRYFEVMLAIYLKALCAMLFPEKQLEMCVILKIMGLSKASNGRTPLRNLFISSTPHSTIKHNGKK